MNEKLFRASMPDSFANLWKPTLYQVFPLLGSTETGYKVRLSPVNFWQRWRRRCFCFPYWLIPTMASFKAIAKSPFSALKNLFRRVLREKIHLRLDQRLSILVLWICWQRRINRRNGASWFLALDGFDWFSFQ